MPGGSEVSECFRSVPCSIEQAIRLANQQGKIVRLLPGVYATPIQQGTTNVTPISIVATGAALTSFTGIAISNGGKASIRGLESTGANFALQCGGQNMPRSRVHLEDVALVAGTSSSNLASIGNCDVTMSNVEFRVNDSTGSSLALTSNSTFTGDRLHFHGLQQPRIATFGTNVVLQMTNSLLENPLILFSTSDMGPGSSVSFGFNTIVMSPGSGTPLDCTPNSGSANRPTLFENNILIALGQTAAVEGSACTLVNNVLLPQPNAPPGNIVADPQFVDAAARNYKLKSTSPAVGSASTAPMIFTDHDFEGTARPQGNAPDIGAFEQ